MNFGEAIELAKEGKLIQRHGWNLKKMFVFMRPLDTIPIHLIPNIKSLPESVKKYLVQEEFNNEIKYASGDTIKVQFTAYLCMKAADGSIVNGWLASQTDMISSDWVELK